MVNGLGYFIFDIGHRIQDFTTSHVFCVEKIEDDIYFNRVHFRCHTRAKLYFEKFCLIYVITIENMLLLVLTNQYISR